VPQRCTAGSVSTVEAKEMGSAAVRSVAHPASPSGAPRPSAASQPVHRTRHVPGSGGSGVSTNSRSYAPHGVPRPAAISARWTARTCAAERPRKSWTFFRHWAQKPTPGASVAAKSSKRWSQRKRTTGRRVAESGGIGRRSCANSIVYDERKVKGAGRAETKALRIGALPCRS